MASLLEVSNFRSERRHLPIGRCLIPASHFFEFTGKKSPKSKWKFTKVGEDWFCFAGLWRPMPEGTGEAFTLLTTEPSPDVAPIHDRQMVVLERADWLAWLDLIRPEAELTPTAAARLVCRGAGARTPQVSVRADWTGFRDALTFTREDDLLLVSKLHRLSRSLIERGYLVTT